jgi:protein-tyrosine phosphatase
VPQTHRPSASGGRTIAGVDDLRDIGGLPAAGGHVRRGLLYRSTHLADLDGEGLASFAELRIRRVYDLRTEHERQLAPDRLPDGPTLVPIDLLADAAGPDPADMMAALTDAAAAETMLGGGRSQRFFVDAYERFVTLPSARAGYGRLYRGLVEGPLPALVHCTTGKDRTGWAVAALLLFLGVSEDEVLTDYLSSNVILAPVSQRLLDRFAAAGGDPELLRPLVEVRETYLAAAISAVRRRHGSAEGYFADGLELDLSTRRRLRDTFVEA